MFSARTKQGPHLCPSGTAPPDTLIVPTLGRQLPRGDSTCPWRGNTGLCPPGGRRLAVGSCRRHQARAAAERGRGKETAERHAEAGPPQSPPQPREHGHHLDPCKL